MTSIAIALLACCGLALLYLGWVAVSISTVGSVVYEWCDAVYLYARECNRVGTYSHAHCDALYDAVGLASTQPTPVTYRSLVHNPSAVVSLIDATPDEAITPKLRKLQRAAMKMLIKSKGPQ